MKREAWSSEFPFWPREKGRKIKERIGEKKEEEQKKKGKKRKKERKKREREKKIILFCYFNFFSFPVISYNS